MKKDVYEKAMKILNKLNLKVDEAIQKIKNLDKKPKSLKDGYGISKDK